MAEITVDKLHRQIAFLQQQRQDAIARSEQAKAEAHQATGAIAALQTILKDVEELTSTPPSAEVIDMPDTTKTKQAEG